MNAKSLSGMPLRLNMPSRTITDGMVWLSELNSLVAGVVMSVVNAREGAQYSGALENIVRAKGTYESIKFG